MTKPNKTKLLLYPILILVLAGLACGNGYRTTQKISGNSGKVRVQTNETNGTDSTEVELNEELENTRVIATVTLSVEAGSCRAILTGEDGTSLTLDAAAGSPAEVSGELVTDIFGEVTLQTEAQNAQNVDLTISFSVR